MTQMVRKAVYLTAELEDKLREEAYLTRQTESEIVRQALEIYFEEVEKQNA